MDDRRRQIVRTIGLYCGGGVLLPAFGCVSIDDDSPQNETGNGEVTETREVGKISIPTPKIKFTQIPEVEIIDQERYAKGEQSKIKLTIVNNGDIGGLVNARVSRVLAAGEDGENEEIFLENKSSTIKPGEMHTFEFAIDWTSETVEYKYEITPVTVQATITNGGAAGNVLVQLVEGGELTTEREIHFEQGATKTVRFNRSVLDIETEWQIVTELSDTR